MENLPGVSIAMATPGRRWLKLAQEFIQYVVVGGLAFLVDWFLLTRGISWGHLSYPVATALGFCAGLITNYTLCILWVWRGAHKQTARDFFLFTAIGLAGLGITELGMWIGVGLAGFGASPVKIVVAGVVLFWNFILRKFLVFSR